MTKANILICDDERGIREALKLILERDYHLFYARNGKEAALRVKTLKPDLLIMDIKMPFLNGLDALRVIRQIDQRVPILIITGYESSDVAVQAVNLGANDYLTKPFEREEVTAKVQALLGLRGSACPSP